MYFLGIVFLVSIDQVRLLMWLRGSELSPLQYVRTIFPWEQQGLCRAVAFFPEFTWKAGTAKRDSSGSIYKKV